MSRMTIWRGSTASPTTLDDAVLYAPLTHSLVLTRGTGSPTFTRASTATVMGYGPTANPGDDAILLTVAANEARFEGARRISEGVWSNTYADGTPLPTTYTYDAVSLNGVAGTYVSTPDSVAASITGDIDIRVKVALADYTPAVENMLANQGDSAINRSIYWILNGVGAMVLITTPDGSTGVSATSTAATGITDGATSWIRVTRDVDNGAGGNTTVFYKSTDGTTWTQIGDAVVNVGTTSVYNSAAPLLFGMEDRFNAYPMNGKLYQAQIYNGINGTLAVDFNASRYAGGTTLTGSTGETWTLQGNAVIHPTNSPNTGYLAEGSGENLCLYSNAGTDTVDINLTSHTYTEPGAPDGTSTFQKILEDATNSTHVSYQPGTLNHAIANSTVTTWSAYVKGGLGRDWCFMSAYDGADNISYFNIATGTTGSNAAGNSSRIESIGNGIYRISITRTTGVASANSGAISVSCAQADGVFSYAGDVTKGIYRWGLQIETGSSASSYIPTTTAAVARNADVDQYPTTAGPIAAAGSIALDFTPYHSPSGTIALWGTYVDASNYTAILHDATNLIFRKRIAGSNYDATIANAFTANTTYKVCGSWGASGVTVTVNGTEGTPHANTTAAQIAATMQWGADGNSLQQPFAAIKNGYIWQRQLSASEMQAITA